MAQKRNGRRGANFSVRVTDEERQALEAARHRLGGPRRLGPWMVWMALGDRAGTASPARQCLLELETRSSGQCPDRALPAPAEVPAQRERLILDLCGGSGSWSAPYLAAGYRVEVVTLPERDVRTFVPPPGVWGILAAPPCNQFSLARNGHPNSPRDLVRGMDAVNACLRVVLQARPRWWALENPVGLLSRFLGTPRDVWNPCDFGDPWTKRTAIWGEYALPARGPFVEPVGSGPLCTVCDPQRRKSTWCNNSAHRAVTPQGFARAFFAANP